MQKRRVPLWLPYADSITISADKETATFKYNGGETTESLSSLSSIMLYGESKPIHFETIDFLARKNIPIVIHRRHMAQPVWITGGTRGDVNDLLSKQILHRHNQKKALHIVKQILRAKFRSAEWIEPIDNTMLITPKTINHLRNIEAHVAKRYWSEYFRLLGIPGHGRRTESEVKKMLDHASKFVSSIMLRWITYHHLSPYHGFLHTQTDYPALVYDLFEPYRPIVDRVIWNYVHTTGIEKATVAGSVVALKDWLDSKTYTDLTRQIVTHHELLHGAVLSMRAYLLGETNKLLLPLPGKPNGGRPKKAGFRLYGRSAGKTDFWTEAQKYSS